MLLFNPVTTQTRVCTSGKRHDWGTFHSIIFFAPSHQSRCNPNGVPSPPKNESPTENEPPIHWNIKSPLKKWFLEKIQKLQTAIIICFRSAKIKLEKNCIICNFTFTLAIETLTFLRPRIWEIVPDYINKSSSFEEFKLSARLH